MPRVSVLIPTRNRAALLQRAVASVQRQTFQDFEILIADDASEDDTPAIVESIGDPRVRYYRHRHNGGVASTRNTLVAHAAGEYVAFIDDDDEWLSDKLERQLALVESSQHAAAIVFTGFQEVDDAGRPMAEHRPSQEGWVFDAILTRAVITPTSTLLVRRSCFEAVGPFDDELRYGEDLDMWLRLARQFEFRALPAPLVLYHIHPNALTRNYRAIVSGLRRLLHRYEGELRRHPRAHSEWLRALGTYCCFEGNLREGRRNFCRAAACDPLRPGPYGSLALSLAGRRLFRACYAVRAMLDARRAGAARSRQA